MEPTHTIIDNAARSRYELLVDGELAGWLAYRPDGDRVVLSHTEVLPGHEGQGLGGVLVRGALDAVRAASRTAVPVCPFAARYIDRHPDLYAYVDASVRPR